MPKEAELKPDRVAELTFLGKNIVFCPVELDFDVASEHL